MNRALGNNVNTALGNQQQPTVKNRLSLSLCTEKAPVKNTLHTLNSTIKQPKYTMKETLWHLYV